MRLRIAGERVSVRVGIRASDERELHVVRLRTEPLTRAGDRPRGPHDGGRGRGTIYDVAKTGLAYCGLPGGSGQI